MVTVYNILRCTSFLLGTDSDGYTVFVGTSDEQDFFFLQTQVTHVNVSRDIYACQVTDVDGAVGVWQR